ncbi:unnamed protein product, partial [Amoebophrya sp. A25]|eukprot:GSA25T00022716001.1
MTDRAGTRMQRGAPLSRTLSDYKSQHYKSHRPRLRTCSGVLSDIHHGSTSASVSEQQDPHGSSQQEPPLVTGAIHLPPLRTALLNKPQGLSDSDMLFSTTATTTSTPFGAGPLFQSGGSSSSSNPYGLAQQPNVASTTNVALAPPPPPPPPLPKTLLSPIEDANVGVPGQVSEKTSWSKRRPSSGLQRVHHRLSRLAAEAGTAEGG